MPLFNGQILETLPDGRQRISPTGLVTLGPILEVSVSIPQALAAFYTKQQIPLPSPVTGMALIDTGATRTCVHGSIMSELQVNPIGVVTSHTAAGLVSLSLYPAHFTIPATKIEIDFASVVGADLSGQMIGSQKLIALIGRDVLSLGILVYNGLAGTFSFAM